VSRPRGETQPERTALSWQRTGLGLLTVAALLIRAAAADGDPLLVLPAGLVAAAGLVVLGGLAPRRRSAARRTADGAGPAQAPHAAAAVTGLVVLAALCGLFAELQR
jgi:putative membrane protein